MEITSAKCCLDTQALFFWRTLPRENTQKLSYSVASQNSRWHNQRLASSSCAVTAMYLRRPFFCRTHSLPTSFSGDDSSENEVASTDSQVEDLPQPMTSEQIMTLLVDSERAKLTKKLSEANMQNRFLKRQLYIKEEALVNFKSELAVLDLELQSLVKLAEEISQYGIPEGSRKINGKYIHSHLVSQLEASCDFLDANAINFASKAVHEKLQEQIKDVDAAQSKEVPVYWFGMAESVQVTGTFDGWSQGEHLSPEYNGSYTRFYTTLMLRPGRYEIKFLVDGEWQLSPEFPTVGEGLTKNNLLVVE